MLGSEKYRDLRNGKRHYTSKQRTMSDNGGIDEKVTGNLLENLNREVYETQEAVNKQIKEFILPLTHPREKWTRLVQGIMTTQHRDHYPRADSGNTSGTNTYQSDMVTASTRTTTNDQSHYKRRDNLQGPWQTFLTACDTRKERPLRAFFRRHYDITNIEPHTNEQFQVVTQVPTFRGTKSTFNEFDHLLGNHLRPMSNKLTEEVELQYFQILLREEAIEFHQSLPETTNTTLNDVYTNFRKKLTKNDLKEVVRYKWDQARHDPTAGTSSELHKWLKIIAKQVLEDNAGQYIQTFFFDKLPISIQQESMNSNKEDARPEEIKLSCTDASSITNLPK